MIRLSKLARELRGELMLNGCEDPVVRDVQLDSRRVLPGDLFCALPGTQTNGARFAKDALERGAVALLLPSDQAELEGLAQCPVWKHDSVSEVSGQAASMVHGRPSRALFTVGVTGTNGKTTVAHLVHQLFTACGKTSGVLGTAGHCLADGRRIAATHTTPDAPELQRLLHEHVRLGGDSIAMEVSSHALGQNRTSGIEFDTAVFTNLTRDHLDYHGDLDSYARTKARLFGGLSGNAHAIVNLDDPASAIMAAAARERGARVLTFSIGSRADLSASQLEFGRNGTSFFLSGMGMTRTYVSIPMAGRYNVENALAATAAVLSSGVSPSDVSEGLTTVSPAPGRLEMLALEERDFDVFVDYAHTDDALCKVLETLRETRDGGRLIVVFGCGGDRDRSKRAAMGAVVNRLSDLAVVTSDNPRSEDPDSIIDDIQKGMSAGRAEVVIRTDRRAAIRTALDEARPGDAVLIAGKGHETTQEIGKRKIPFDDRLVALEEMP